MATIDRRPKRQTFPLWKHVILEAWTVSYALSFFFIALQAFLMADQWFLIIVMILLPVAIYFGLRALCRAHLRRGLVSGVFLAIIAAAHLLPALFQLLGSGAPNIDVVISGIVGIALFSTF